MNKVSLLVILSIFSILYSCTTDDKLTISSDPVDDTSNTSDSPNILVIIADDLGKDAINGYAEGTIKPTTPNIDAIRNNGLMFTNLWVNPTCSPTRASIITGKYGYRTGVKGASDQLAQSEEILQAYISKETNNKYASAIIGKWHLSGNNSTFNPESFGIDYYTGLIRGSVDDYYQWQLTEDGVSTLQTDYITEAFTNLSIDWINEQSKPWFLWLAYNAPHTPFHAPPNAMHSQGDLPSYTNGMDPIPYYMASIEAMDYQIGRLLNTLSTNERDNTIIMFVGDNGTPNQVAQTPYSSTKVKNTLYQGGINTPLFVSGYGVTRVGIDNNIITSTDLFTTIAQIAGSPISEIHDSKSFKSLFTTNNDYSSRSYQYSEMNDGVTDAWTISNGAYKLIVNSSGDEQMFNLINDTYETNNLLNGNLSTSEQDIKIILDDALSTIRN